METTHKFFPVSFVLLYKDKYNEICPCLEDYFWNRFKVNKIGQHWKRFKKRLSWRFRPSIRFCLSSCDVRSKGEAFPSRRCKLKNLTLCNQKYRLFLYLLGKCFAPTSLAESLGNRTPHLGCHCDPRFLGRSNPSAITGRAALEEIAAEWRIPYVHCHFGGDSSLLYYS